jgi:hypothetical protein
MQMSKNLNRKKLNEAEDDRSYRILLKNRLNPPYWDECWTRHSRRTFYSREGSKNLFSWKRKEIYEFEYREYRTWKYNRKTQWKQ